MLKVDFQEVFPQSEEKPTNSLKLLTLDCYVSRINQDMEESKHTDAMENALFPQTAPQEFYSLDTETL